MVGPLPVSVCRHVNQRLHDVQAIERFHRSRSGLSWLQLRLALSCCIADPQRGRLLRPPRQACFADAQNCTRSMKTLQFLKGPQDRRQLARHDHRMQIRLPISRATCRSVQSGCSLRIVPPATSWVSSVQRKQQSSRCCGDIRLNISICFDSATVSERRGVMLLILGCTLHAG